MAEEIDAERLLMAVLQQFAERTLSTQTELNASEPRTDEIDFSIQGTSVFVGEAYPRVPLAELICRRRPANHKNKVFKLIAWFFEAEKLPDLMIFVLNTDQDIYDDLRLIP